MSRGHFSGQASSISILRIAVTMGAPWNSIVWTFSLMAFCIDLGEEIAGDAGGIPGGYTGRYCFSHWAIDCLIFPFPATDCEPARFSLLFGLHPGQLPDVDYQVQRSRLNCGANGLTKRTPSNICPSWKSSLKMTLIWFRRAAAQIWASQ
jgi:hypothetical protein